MYYISVEADFDAAHYLREYKGKCESLHGHTFRVVVTLKADHLDKTGIAYDFTLLKRQLNEVIAGFDHVCLNDIAPFDKINPSSENIASVVYEKIEKILMGEPVRLAYVEVWESPTSHVLYKND